MQVSVNIQAGADETLSMSINKAAEAVLKALKLDPEKDIVTVFHTQNEQGTAGTVPAPPPSPGP